MKKTIFFFALFVSISQFVFAKERLIVIDGSLTEITYALNAENNLVAVDTTSIYPKAATKLPNVGYMRALSAEGILSMTPTMVITSDSAGPKPVLDKLSKAGVKLHTFKNDYTLEGIFTKIDSVATLLDKVDEANILKTQLNTQVKKINSMIANKNNRPKVLVFLGMQGNQMMAAGENTQAQAVLDIIGAENAVTGFNGYRPLNKEAVLAAKADAIVLLSHTAEKDKSAAEAYAYTAAYKNRKVKVFESSKLLGFGPRMPYALEGLIELVYQ